MGRLKLSEVEDIEPASQRAIQPASHKPAEPASHSAGEPSSQRIQKDRLTRKAVTVWFPPDVHKQIKVVAARRDMTIQEVFERALDDWFQKNQEHRFLKR